MIATQGVWLVTPQRLLALGSDADEVMLAMVLWQRPDGPYGSLEALGQPAHGLSGSLMAIVFS